MTRGSVLRVLSRLAAAAALLMTFGAVEAEASVSIVPIAPSPTFTTPVPSGLDDAGMVVGNSGAQPFTWTATTGYSALQASELGYTNGVTGVSPGGEVLGSAASTYFDGASAIIWPAGAGSTTAPTFLGCYPNTPDQSEPCGPNLESSYGNAANASGVIFGSQSKYIDACAGDQFGCSVPTAWPAGGGTPQEIGAISGNGIDINANNTVLWAGGGAYHVTAGASDTQITCLTSAGHINAAGTVIGATASGPAFWSAGACHNLPLLAGTTSGAAEAINDGGLVVGHSATPGSSKAVEWSGGNVIDLNTFLTPGSGWILGDAFAVNASGQILGSGTLNGQPSYFLLSGTQYTVSGAVYGEQCTAVSCGESGLPGQTVLLQGKASDGTTVNKSITTAADGTWSVKVPPGSYTAGPSLDGSTIKSVGFDPEQQAVIVKAANVPGVDFRTCGANPTEAAGDGSPFARPAAISEKYVYLCQATYTFQAKAEIHQESFVDPSSQAPYAVHLNGTGYRADNQDHGGEWGDKLPECSRFDGERKKPTPLKWLSYYQGTKSLGTATISLTYERYTNDLTPSGFKLAAGSLSRVYKFDKKPGHCEVTRPVVPQFTTLITSPTTFRVVVSWPLPFLPSGYEAPPELSKLPGVATNVHKLVDKIAEETPGFKKLPEAAQAAIVYAVAHRVEEFSFHGLVHHFPATATIVELVEDSIAIEKAGNIAILLYNVAGIVGNKAAGKLGYHPMTMAIRGKFVTVPCPLAAGTTFAKCNDTVLSMDVTTDRFPDYTLTMLRSGKGGGVKPVSNRSVPGKVVVVSGSEAEGLPGETRSEISASKGSTGDQVELWKAMKAPVGPGAAEVGAGAALEGLPPSAPACNVSDDARQILSVGTASTRCYGFQDGLP